MMLQPLEFTTALLQIMIGCHRRVNLTAIATLLDEQQ